MTKKYWFNKVDNRVSSSNADFDMNLHCDGKWYRITHLQYVKHRVKTEPNYKPPKETFDDYYDSLDWSNDLKHLNIKQAMKIGVEWERNRRNKPKRR